jgi:hypothetical protein
VAVTFVDWNDLQRWKIINDALGLGHPEPPETYSTSEHLFSALGIPAGTGSRLAPDTSGRQGLEAEELEDLGETGKYRSAGHRPGAELGRDRQRTRTRRRTRGGVPIGGEGPATEHPAAHSQNHPAAHSQGHPAGHSSAPRRRRRRRGKGRTGSAEH